MKTVFLAALILLSSLSVSCSNGLRSCQNLLVGQPAATVPAPGPDKVTITYLGVNGYLIRSGATTIVVDPYFSRFSLREIAMNAPIKPKEELIESAATKAAMPSKIDGYLVTHSHFDHLFDVPALQRTHGGRIVTSRTGAYLCEAVGVPESALLPAEPGDHFTIGTAKIQVLAACHDFVLGSIPYPGLITEPLLEEPCRPRDWKLGSPLAYLIELGGKRIYVESGGIVGHPPIVSKVDLAIVGTAVGDGKGRYAEAVRLLDARYVLPSHQDNFFIPWESGFQFSAISDFPRVRSIDEAEQLPGELMMMDYFHTWTIPD